jgi:uncharacterized protein YqjF (DUF2071 family)
MKPDVFLTAEWKNLLMLNYAVDPALLRPYVPAGTELDSFDGTTYLSLIGFEFNRTRISGIPAPFHQAFEEVNLRLYVRRESKRGVVFIRELVPKRLVALVARLAFNENYSYVPMSHRIETEPGGDVRKAEYAWMDGSNRCSMNIETEGPRFVPAEGSVSQFITEHYWGYAKQKDGSALEYEVEHPRWSVWEAKHAMFSGNATDAYGATFAEIVKNKPDSAFLAEGSAVTVYGGTKVPL